MNDNNYDPDFSSTLAAVKNAGAQIIFAKDMNAQGSKNYTSALTHEQFLRYAKSLPLSEQCFYEVIFADKPVKLHFDIDICPGVDDDMKEMIIHEIIDKTRQSLKEQYDVVNINENDFAILDASGTVTKKGCVLTKTSMHIILVNKVCWTKVHDMKKYVNTTFVDNNGQTIVPGLDLGIYRAGCFRMPGSTKKSQNRHLRIITEQYNELDCMITNIDVSSFRTLGPASKVKKNNNNVDKYLQSQIGNQQITDDVIFEQCVHALPRSLSEDYEMWISVGIKLYLAGAPEKYWHDFSKKCEQKYNYDFVQKKWKSFTNYGQGNMSGLFTLMKKYGAHDIVNAITLRTLQFMGKYNNDIALGLSRLYSDKHAYTRDTWYYFDGYRWVEDRYKTYISRTIMTDFQERLDREILNLNMTSMNETTTPTLEKGQEEIRLKNLYTIKEKTQSGRIGTDWHVLNVAFDQPHLFDNFDMKLDLIGFDNGVYDLENDVFRPTERDDYITMSTRYSYESFDEIPEQDMTELCHLLKQFFPDHTIHEYMMRFLGSCLSGKVNEELIHFWTGLSNKQTGSNGKSTFVTLLMQTFGDYGACGHSSIITSRRETSNNANSALMHLKGRRLVTFQEIDNENTINMPVIKAMTGNDVITGRQLYKSQETFTPHWKLIVCANKLPPVSSDDGGTRRRLRNIPFESKFVEDIHDPKWQTSMCGGHVYPINYSLKSKIHKYKMPLMYMLIQGYKRYKNSGGLIFCDKVQTHTLAYFKQHDALYQYFIEYIRPHESRNVLLRDILIRQGGKYKDEDILVMIEDHFPNMIVRKNEYDKYMIMNHTIDEN